MASVTPHLQRHGYKTMVLFLLHCEQDMCMHINTNAEQWDGWRTQALGIGTSQHGDRRALCGRPSPLKDMN